MKGFKISVLYIMILGIVLTMSVYTITLTGCGKKDSGPSQNLNWQYYLYSAAMGGSSVINAYTINAIGALTQVAGQPFAASTSPWSLTVDPAGRFLYSAATSSVINAYSIANTGALTQILGADGLPFAASDTPKSITIDPAGNFLYSAASSSLINAYSITPVTGRLVQVAGQPFAASNTPTSLIIEASGSFLYAVASSSPELATSTINAYSINTTTGVLTQVAGQPFNVSTSPLSVTSVTFNDYGTRFLYAAAATSSGGVATSTGSVINAYSINGTTGVLTQVAGQPFNASNTPVSVTVGPASRFLYAAATSSSVINAYSINRTTGVLTQVAGQPFAASSTPASLAVDQVSNFLYAAATSTSTVINAYSINPTTGVLTQVAGQPFNASTSPNSVAVGRKDIR